jgi:hypothetical protein
MRHENSSEVFIVKRTFGEHTNELAAFDVYFYNLGSPETSLWIAVIEKMLLDYAYLVRRKMNNNITQLQEYNLTLLTRSLFDYDGSLSDIINIISGEPEYLLKKIRAVVSQENIESEIILGRKMREIEY